MTAPRTARMRPGAGEYAPYYEKYVSLIQGDDVLDVIEAQRMQMGRLLAGRGEREGNFRYAAGKWSVKEVIGHINDAERIFSYRALRIARGDTTPLAGFEQDGYVQTGGFGERTLAELAEEFEAIRSASVLLFRSFGAEAWARQGVASNAAVTVRALAYILAGHELHHRRILEERYFAAIPRA